MPKTQQTNLTADEKLKRNEILHILNLNVAQCMLQKKMPQDAIKHANESLTYQESPKAYYRLHVAYKMLNDLDRAKENLQKALQLAPQDQTMRAQLQ